MKDLSHTFRIGFIGQWDFYRIPFRPARYLGEHNNTFSSLNCQLGMFFIFFALRVFVGQKKCKMSKEIQINMNSRSCEILLSWKVLQFFVFSRWNSQHFVKHRLDHNPRVVLNPEVSTVKSSSSFCHHTFSSLQDKKHKLSVKFTNKSWCSMFQLAMC